MYTAVTVTRAVEVAADDVVVVVDVAVRLAPVFWMRMTVLP